MITNDINPAQGDLAVSSSLRSIETRTLKSAPKKSIKTLFNKVRAISLLAVTGLLLAPVTNAAVSFTNAEGDYFQLSNSRVQDAHYSGGSNMCNISPYYCLSTYYNVPLVNDTVISQDSENVRYGIQTMIPGVQFHNEFFVPADGKFIRKLTTIYNSNPYSVNLNLVYDLNYFNLLGINTVNTSSGDAIANTADTWAVVHGDGSIPYTPYYSIYWGTNAAHVSGTWFYEYWNQTIPAGETRYMIIYAAVDNNAAVATNLAASIAAGSAYRQYEGLDAEISENGINYDPFYSVSLSASDLIAEQGSTVTHTLTVDNSEAFDLNFNVTVNNSPSWATEPAVSSIFVPAGGSTTFDVTVNVPVYANLFAETDQAQILISGTGASSGINRTAYVTTRTKTAQLTHSPVGSTNFSSALSADGKVIVFSSNEDLLFDGSNADGSLEVFRIDSDGTGLMQLTSSSDDSFLESVNNDASKIVYRVNNSGVHRFFVMDGSGNNIVHLNDNDSVGAFVSQEIYASITSDGNQVVFIGKDNDDSSLDIFKINSDGTGLLQLTDIDTGDSIAYPDISDAGDVIVFLTEADINGMNNSHNYAVYSIDANGDNLRLLSDPDSISVRPSLSGNGQYVTFSSNTDGLLNDNDDGSYEIYRVSVDGSEIVQLTATSYSSYMSSLSYDGTRVLISSRGDLLGNGSNNDGSEEIFIINVNPGDTGNGSMLQLTQSSSDSTTLVSNLSSDGSRVTFTSFGNLTAENPDLTQELFISFLDGRQFDNTVFSGGIFSLIKLGYRDDAVQAILDDRFNGIGDDETEQSTVTKTKDGALGFDSWFLLLLFSFFITKQSGKFNRKAKF